MNDRMEDQKKLKLLLPGESRDESILNIKELL